MRQVCLMWLYAYQQTMSMCTVGASVVSAMFFSNVSGGVWGLMQHPMRCGGPGEQHTYSCGLVCDSVGCDGAT